MLLDTQLRSTTWNGSTADLIFRECFANKLGEASSRILAIPGTASLPVRVHDEITIAGQSNPKLVEQPRSLGRVDRLALANVPAQCHPGVGLIDVLATRAAGAARRFADLLRAKHEVRPNFDVAVSWFSHANTLPNRIRPLH